MARNFLGRPLKSELTPSRENFNATTVEAEGIKADVSNKLLDQVIGGQCSIVVPRMPWKKPALEERIMGPEQLHQIIAGNPGKKAGL